MSKRPRLAFYGDDFTGATDALEVLAFAGLRCALFLEVPDAAMLARFDSLDAFGVAGTTRGMNPAEMDAVLPSALARLRNLDVPLVHYKVCSTFDSAPSIGSIGHVLELARTAFGPAPVPIVAATPALGRFCLFGNLFARSGTDGRVHRLDRHPVMSRHPVTPMDEADLVRHLGRQTALPIERFEWIGDDDVPATTDRRLARTLESAPAAILFDGATAAHMTAIGRLLASPTAPGQPRFVIGSSGAEYALTQWWRQLGELPATPPDYTAFDPAPAVLAVSGSASPLSALQVDAAVAAGFVDVAADAAALVDDARREAMVGRLVEEAATALRQGRSVMMHTARGPDDPRIPALLDILVAGGLTREEAQRRGGRALGETLGGVVDGILRRTRVRRLLLSGGDSSSQITRVLAPDALEIEARLAPGAPLCRLHARAAHVDGVQLALKGGQMGGHDYFVQARNGAAPAHVIDE